MLDNVKDVPLVDSGDEPMSNDSGNTHFSQVLEARLSRRSMLGGSLTAAVTGILGTSMLSNLAVAAPAKQLPPAAGKNPAFALNPSLGFEAVPAGLRSDTVTIPSGYRAQVLIPWGTPINGISPAFILGVDNTGEQQEQQEGSHHDGMHFFPMQDDPNGHGLLCLNHEYVDQFNFHNGLPNNTVPRPEDQVRKEIAAHGVTVVELQRDGSEWNVVDGKYNRRITANTEMELSGPVRGSDLVRTLFSPDGTRTRGTINNCGHGFTPWGTYLTGEENWSGYFINKDDSLPREHKRFGVRDKTRTSRYLWKTAVGGADQYVRFDASTKATDATLDYRNEPNGQGWVVEIDPFAPASIPKKRTTLGRYAHEGAWVAPVKPGERVVVYCGDDARNEYVYKFVSKGKYEAGVRGEILDEGTLYAARFNEDGSGDWLALDIDDPDFQSAALFKGVPFADQADVLVNTRLAADVVGATPMDRPEWGAVHPQTREVFMTMTNNSSRGTVNPTDAANPRAPNPYGHIIRWREQGNRSWSTRFQWDLFVLAGPETDSQILPDQDGPALDTDNIFASPDGLWIDQFGVMWIQTDMSGSQQGTGPFGENQMLAANPFTGEIRRFMVGPPNQETTGVVSTPDGKTLFVNIQHPGDRSNAMDGFTSNWPDNGHPISDPSDSIVMPVSTGPRPRSATVVITREDGGIVGLA